MKSPKKRTKFFTFSKNTTSEQNQRELTKFKRELDDYLTMNYDPDDEVANFWLANKKRFPLLFDLVLKFLSIPASSGPVERLFSKSGYINRPHRSRMTSKNLKATTVL